MSLYKVIKDRLGADIPTHEKDLNEIRDIYFLGQEEPIFGRKEDDSYVAVNRLFENTGMAKHKLHSSILEIFAREAIEFRETARGEEFLSLAEHFAVGNRIGSCKKQGGGYGFLPVPHNDERDPDPSELTIENHFADGVEKYHVQRALAIFYYAKAVYAWDSGDQERYEEDLAKAREAADKAYKRKKDDLQIITYKLLASKKGVPVVDMLFPQVRGKRQENPEIDPGLLEQLRDSFFGMQGKVYVKDPLAIETFVKLRDSSYLESLKSELGHITKDLGGLIPRNPRCNYRIRQAMNAYFEKIILPLELDGKVNRDEERENFYELVEGLLGNDDYFSIRGLKEIFTNMERLYFGLVSNPDGLASDEVSRVFELVRYAGGMRILAKKDPNNQYQRRYQEILLNEGEYSELLGEGKGEPDRSFVKRVIKAATDEFRYIETVNEICTELLPGYLYAKEEQRKHYQILSRFSSSQQVAIRETEQSLAEYNQYINSNIKEITRKIRSLEKQIAKEKLPGSRYRQQQALKHLIDFIGYTIQPYVRETSEFNRRVDERWCESPIDVFIPTLKKEAKQLMHELSLMHKALLDERFSEGSCENYPVIAEKHNKINSRLRKSVKQIFDLSENKLIRIPKEQIRRVIDALEEDFPETIGCLEERLDTVVFHGKELYRNDYESLQSLAQQYFNTTAEEYFSNLEDAGKDVYLEIKDRRVNRLKINSQGLEEIPAEINRLTGLGRLDLWNNKIKKIENLEGLKELRLLGLGSNQIRKIENLEELKELEVLALYNNQISRIENLEKLKELEVLNLENNQINKIENLEELKKLGKLYLYSNQISKIENLEELKELRDLDLGGNKISRIENLEELKELRELYLYSNQISKIENLEELKELKMLYLKENQISKIENLEELKELSVLHLGHNNISKIENLEELKELSVLHLGHNNISKIENLEKLKKLGKLYLYSNQISKIENLEELKELEKLHLNHNKIKEIENLEELKELEKLHLNHNKIKEIENLEELKELEALGLGNNQISKIENLEELKKLISLHLENNQISKIENLEELKELTMLNLNDNQIRKIENLEELKKLISLHLENNQISRIENLEELKELKKKDIIVYI